MEKPVSIYLLEDPLDGLVFYVGKTESELRVRLNGHICEALAGKHSAAANIQRIIQAGDRPVIRRVELVEAGGDWAAAEKKWIAHYRALGPIANRCSGGQGVSGALRTAEWYQKIVASRRASGKAAEGAKRAAEKNRGRVQSAAERERHGLLQLGRKHTEEAKAKISAFHKGRPHTAEQIEKMATKKRGVPHSKSTIEKITAAAIEQAHLRSDEQLARWADPEYYERVTASMRSSQAARRALKAQP